MSVAKVARTVLTAARLDATPRVDATRWSARVATLGRVLDATGRTTDEPGVLGLLAGADDETAWLALAVLSAQLPTAADVVDARRAAQLRGPGEILAAARGLTTVASTVRDVVVVTDRTLVDIGDLVLSPLATGIQRVARNVGTAWRTTRDFDAVAWTADHDALRLVDERTRDAALDGRPHPVEVVAPGTARPETVVVPWRCTYVLPELAVQPRRCAALQALARFSPTRCGLIGFDCVPLTSAETSAHGFAAVFALNLAAAAEFDVVATISGAAATEYEGWREMISGAGLAGPRIEPLLLPAHAPLPTDEDLADARERFVVAGMPMVLCVGSHEPRKNHLAVLHAAELLWRRGVRFSLTFVGGASWNSDEFTRRLAELQALGRPVESVRRLSDPMLWAAYRLARCTLFPSINEGFGLPVAESLAAGTPAITSGFGSMREIAQDGGALLVDPRDDHDLADALGRVLQDDALHAQLVAQARRRRPTTWGEYADDLWHVFHGTEA